MRRTRDSRVELVGVSAAREDLARLARGSVLNAAGGALAAGSAFAYAVIATRSLGAEDAGVLFAAIAMSSIVLALATFGTDVGLTRSVARAQALGQTADLRRTIVVAIVPVAFAGTALGVALALAAGVLGRTIDPAGGAGESAIRVLATALPFAAVAAALLAGSRGLGTMVPSFLVDSVLKSGLRLLAAVGVAAAGLGVAGMAVAWAVPACAALLAAAVVVHRRIERPGPATPATSSRELAARFWLFAAPRGVAGTLQVTLLWLDTILLGALASAAEAGVYAAAARYVLVGTLALQAVGLMVGPQIVQMLAAGARDRAQTLYEVSTAWLVSISWPVCLTLALFAPVFLRLFGHGFEAGTTALVLLSAAMLLNTATGPVSVVLLMTGRSVANLANVATALTTNIALNALLIPRYGMTGAAIAWAAAIAVMNVLPLWQIRRGLGLWPFGSGFARAAAAAVACYVPFGLAVRLLGGVSIGSLAVAVTGSTVLYALFLYRCRGALHLASAREAATVAGVPAPVR